MLSAPEADPALVMKHIGDDLEQLAREGIVELHTGRNTPSSPDETHRGSLEPTHLQHAELAG